MEQSTRIKLIMLKQLVGLILRNELSLGFFAFLVLILLFLTSCAGNNVRSDTVAEQYASSLKTDRLNTELTRKNLEYRRTFSVADYKIGPEDLLEIEVFQVPDLKTLARVSARGYIKLPLLEGLEAGGLTVSELESLIAERLRKYVKDPVVTVFVKEFRSQQISILGSVQGPRVYYVTGQKYLLDILSMAGGLTQDAGSVCIIQRVSGTAPVASGKQYIERIVIDLDELLINGKAELNIPVISGDTIHVLKSGIFFVDGGVQSPGSFPMKGKTTLTQALTMARGLSFEAVRSDIKIYRYNEKAEREILTVDYDSVMEGTSPDIEIKDKDFIVASKSGLKSFIKGFATGLNFGFFSLGKGIY